MNIDPTVAVGVLAGVAALAYGLCLLLAGRAYDRGLRHGHRAGFSEAWKLARGDQPPAAAPTPRTARVPSPRPRPGRAKVTTGR